MPLHTDFTSSHSSGISTVCVVTAFLDCKSAVIDVTPLGALISASDRKRGRARRTLRPSYTHTLRNSDTVLAFKDRDKDNDNDKDSFESKSQESR